MPALRVLELLSTRDIVKIRWKFDRDTFANATEVAAVRALLYTDTTSAYNPPNDFNPSYGERMGCFRSGDRAFLYSRVEQQLLMLNLASDPEQVVNVPIMTTPGWIDSIKKIQDGIASPIDHFVYFFANYGIYRFDPETLSGSWLEVSAWSGKAGQELQGFTDGAYIYVYHRFAEVGEVARVPIAAV